MKANDIYQLQQQIKRKQHCVAAKLNINEYAIFAACVGDLFVESIKDINVTYDYTSKMRLPYEYVSFHFLNKLTENDFSKIKRLLIENGITKNRSCDIIKNILHLDNYDVYSKLDSETIPQELKKRDFSISSDYVKHDDFHSDQCGIACKFISWIKPE